MRRSTVANSPACKRRTTGSTNVTTISDYIDKQGYVRYRDAIAQAPWLWNAGTRSFISYDDPRSIAAKAAFVKAHHLGGIMYWEQSLDPGDELLDAIWHGLQ